jgi:hypothetical protein
VKLRFKNTVQWFRVGRALLCFALFLSQPALAQTPEWAVSLYPNGHPFAFTIVHDADSAYSQRLAPLFDVFDNLGFRITATAFVFWAQWAREGRVWAEWNRLNDPNYRFFAPKAVPLADPQERLFYRGLAARGHEIGMHSPSDTSDTRKDLIRAFEYFRDVFGHYPKVYVEHASNSNKEAQANEGSNPASSYYNTDLLERYGAWIWVDGAGALPDPKNGKFFDLLASNNSPFSRFALETYGIQKGFIRSGKWRDSTGDGFLQWYSEANIDALENNRGMALVYTHLNAKWLDPQTREMRSAIKNRLGYLAAKRAWLAPAGEILDRTLAIGRLRLYQSRTVLKIVNPGAARIDGLTILSRRRRALKYADKTWRPTSRGDMVIGTIHPGETLSLTIM